MAMFLLGMSTFAGTVTGVVFLIWYGINVVWWAPLILCVLSFLSVFVATLIKVSLVD